MSNPVRRFSLVRIMVLLGIVGGVLWFPCSLSGEPLRRTTTRLVVRSDTGTTLDTLTVSVSVTPLEKYMGLSGTDRLDTGTGMWFVYSRPDTRTFVMRGMNYSLDIVFVGPKGTITAIRSAPVETSPPLTKHKGWAQYVLEVNRGWAARHGVTVGDRVLQAGETGSR